MACILPDESKLLHTHLCIAVTISMDIIQTGTHLSWKRAYTMKLPATVGKKIEDLHVNVYLMSSTSMKTMIHFRHLPVTSNGNVVFLALHDHLQDLISANSTWYFQDGHFFTLSQMLSCKHHD